MAENYFAQGYAVGSDFGAGFADRRRRKKFENALAAGDFERASLADPDRAEQYQALQLKQKASEQLEEDTARQRQRSLALEGAKAFRQMVDRGEDPTAAAEKLTPFFSRFENPENVTAFFGELAQDPSAALAYEQALSEDPKGAQFLNTSGGVFDTQSREFIQAPPKQGDPLDQEYKRAQIAAAQALANQRNTKAAEPQTQKPTKGQEALDRAFAKEVVEWNTNGAATTATNLALLDDAVRQLNENEGLSGPIAGLGPVWARQLLNPQGAAVQQQVQTAVQSSLKATLGAQFARIEGEQLLDRAFAPTQQEGENARRVAIVAERTRELAAARQAQSDYFLENGTMRGYKGPDFDALAERLISTLRDFAKDTPAPKKSPESKTPDDINSLLDKYAGG